MNLLASLKSSLAVNPVMRLCLGSMTAAALLMSPSAQAQVGLSPLIIELEAERGQAEGVISVVNSTSEEFRARVYVEPFTYTRDSGFVTLDSDPSDLTPYLQFSPRELSVPPNTTRRVRFVSRFAPSHPEGEYRAVIFTENLVETTTAEGAQVTLKTRIGSTVYVRNGDLSPDLQAVSARYDETQEQIQVLVENGGQASSRANIAWEIAQAGQVLQSGQSSEESIIAETDRYLTILDLSETDAPLSPGNYQIFGEVRWFNADQEEITAPFDLNVTLPSI